MDTHDFIRIGWSEFDRINDNRRKNVKKTRNVKEFSFRGIKKKMIGR